MRRGFTLIELLVVMSILAILMTIVVLAVAGPGRSAKIQKAHAFIAQLRSALGSYFEETRSYPPDGYDTPCVLPNGASVKGSASLTYHLAWLYPNPPGSGNLKKTKLHKQIEDVTGEVSKGAPLNQGQPYLTKKNLSEKDIGKNGELLDPWGRQYRYDNLEEDDQGNVMRNIIRLDGAPDPREVRGRPNGFNPGSYDLWSAGPDAKKVDDDIGIPKK